MNNSNSTCFPCPGLMSHRCLAPHCRICLAALCRAPSKKNESLVPFLPAAPRNETSRTLRNPWPPSVDLKGADSPRHGLIGSVSKWQSSWFVLSQDGELEFTHRACPPPCPTWAIRTVRARVRQLQYSPRGAPGFRCSWPSPCTDHTAERPA